MTALQLAKAECANCDSPGNCAGVGIAEDLSSYMFRQPGKCYLAEQPIKRCVYFEQCVAPLPKKRAQPASTQEQQRATASLSEGVRAYEMAVMPGPTVKRLPSAKAATGECMRLNAYASNALGTTRSAPSDNTGLGLEKMGLSSV